MPKGQSASGVVAYGNQGYYYGTQRRNKTCQMGKNKRPDGTTRRAIRAEKSNYGDRRLVLIECANCFMKCRRDHHVQYVMHMKFFL